MVLVTALLATTLVGCGQVSAVGPSAARGATAAPTSPVARTSYLALIYQQVLVQYWTSGDNSFGPRAFPLVFVLDRAEPDAADPMRTPGGATPAPIPIGAADQQFLANALGDQATVRFVADRDSVLVTKDGCAQVRDGGILIVLGPPVGGAAKVTVGIHGFVACLGATWFTYVVENHQGEWRVTGKTGSYAIA